MTVGEAIAEFGVEHAAMGRLAKAWQSFAREVSIFFGVDSDLPSAMRAASVTKYVAYLRQRGNSNQTLANKLAFLSNLCRLSTEAGQPVAFPRRIRGAIKVNNQRQRVLSDKEKAALYEALPCTEDQEVLEFAMSTGLRSRELFGLEVADCDFGIVEKVNEQGEVISEVTVEINVRAELTRTKVARRFPLVGWARDYCVRARDAGRVYVVKLVGFEHYTSRRHAGENWKQLVVRPAVRRAGVKDWHVHDTRHQACTDMIEAGMDTMSVTTILGWQSGTYLRRYTNLRMRTLASAMQLFEDAKNRKTAGL